MINFKGLEGLVYVQGGKNPIYIYIHIYIYIYKIPSLTQHNYALVGVFSLGPLARSSSDLYEVLCEKPCGNLICLRGLEISFPIQIRAVLLCKTLYFMYIYIYVCVCVCVCVCMD